MTIDWARVLAVVLLSVGTWFVAGLIVAIGFGIWTRRVRRLVPHG